MLDAQINKLARIRREEWEKICFEYINIFCIKRERTADVDINEISKFWKFVYWFVSLFYLC